MHNAAFAALGWPAHYQARDILPADLVQAVEALRGPQVLGANLSLPHKESVLSLLDSLSSAAKAIGAVNTIVNRAGHLHGDNTDAPGLLLALEGAGAALHAGGVAAVLGAGGAARAAVWALRSRGLEVYVVNRTLPRAQALVGELGGVAAGLGQVPWERVDVLVNATSVGLGDPEATPLPDFDWARLPARALVYDMVYKPAQTRLLREARAAGLSAENGLSMLAQQARLAFSAWTGQDAALEVFLGALEGQ